MTTIDIPDEIHITTVQKIFSRQGVEVGGTPGIIELGVDASVKPEDAAKLAFMLNQTSTDVEVEIIIRKKQ